VGERKWDAQRVRAILERGDRPQAGPTAPAHGLYLVSVDYGEART
jgi:tRNA U38,U39,U40 pseudouridine synthase TruA